MSRDAPGGAGDAGRRRGPDLPRGAHGPDLPRGADLPDAPAEGATEAGAGSSPAGAVGAADAAGSGPPSRGSVEGAAIPPADGPGPDGAPGSARGLDRLREALRRPLLVIGRVGLDVFTEPGVALEDAPTMRVGMGGSAANTAAGFVKLGGRAALLTCVSDDAVGSTCLAHLDRHGVERAHVRAVGGEHRNSLAVYESRVQGHRNVIYRNGAADFAMEAADVDAVDLSRFGAVVTAGTVFAAEPFRTAAFHAFERARAAGLPILFDVDHRPYSWPSPQVASEVLSRAGAAADVIVGNDEEFGFMAGGVERGLAEARALAERATLVVYKMGERGAVSFAGAEEIATGVYETDALKPTGAGDAFMAGLLSGLAMGLPLRDAILRGSACAAIVVARPGCAPAMPDAAELEDWLEGRPDPV